MTKRTYDIRVRKAIARSGNPDLFTDLNIPRSTTLQWIREGVKEVVTHASLGKSCDALIEEKLMGAINTARNHLSLKECLESI